MLFKIPKDIFIPLQTVLILIGDGACPGCRSGSVRTSLRKAPRSLTPSAMRGSTLARITLSLAFIREVCGPIEKWKEDQPMIDLTRLNGNRFVVNCDLIKFAEAAPDTTITLITGEKLIVRDSCDDLIARVIAYRSEVLRAAWPEAAPSLNAKSAHDIFSTHKE
jgi:flagellar protein FlbD